MNRIRIGTRDSKLAHWQAKHVAARLTGLGLDSEIVFIKSEGDLDLTTPLAEMGGKGVFTKALDEALLNRDIDIAAHSYKDLPTENPLPLEVAAVLERDDPRDCLVAPEGADFLEETARRVVIATSSTRRRAQWLHRFPEHEITNIRGNVQTRLKKIESNPWNGGIFAAAGLVRLNLEHHITEFLDWMVPAPAQGAIAVMIRVSDRELGKQIASIGHSATTLCTGIERELLNRMEAGCSAPVGAFAWVENDHVMMQAVALKTDGSLQFDVEMTAPVREAGGMGVRAADALLAQGADSIIEEIRNGS